MTTEAPGRRATVRARILATVLTLTALALTVAGGTAWILQRNLTDERVDGLLRVNVAEFRALAAANVDPATGGQFTDVRALLRLAIQRTAPAENEGMLAFVDGRLALTAPTETVPLRVEEDADFVRAAAAHTGEEQATLRTLTTPTTTYRYAAIPVEVVGDDRPGLLVYAFDRRATHASLTAIFRTYALVSLGAVAVIGVVGWVLAGRLLAPIRGLRRTAQQISDTDLSARIPVTGSDDLSDLTRTVNAMLDRLEAAFASQRRLLDDAGHELRTPLTIVRGHLELLDPADAEEVAATRALVLDEVDRMHRLVDDLVTLATADRPDFVRPVPTDVAALTAEVVDKARLLGRHEWRLERAAPVRAVLDPQRITQALLQLAANATKFAPEGTLVRVASEARDGTLLLSVTDEGPGVPPEDAERVFDRFARGTSGRGVEGSGLGLPIVAAIAAAHGGRAHVEAPESGTGARFVVAIPLRPAPRADPEEAA
jgi:signal transduction histidine kinase